jgi:hypothetical protein
MIEELFVGIARAPRGAYGRCVCIDGLGRSVEASCFAWTPARLSELMRWLVAQEERGISVTVGVMVEDLDAETSALLRGGPIVIKGLERAVVDAMEEMLRRKQRTLGMRARCVAQMLLLADYPPKSLGLEANLRLARW